MTRFGHLVRSDLGCGMDSAEHDSLPAPVARNLPRPLSQRTEVIALVFRQGCAMIALGLAIGAVGALWLPRVMQGLVFGIGARDPLTLIVACLTLAAVGLIASLGPARRATTVDPVVALRTG